MMTLRELLHRCHWSDVQDAIRIDPTVSLRIDDSDEEDYWFINDVRRLKSVDSTPGIVGVNHEGSNYNSVNAHDVEESSELRYWVGVNANSASRDVIQRRTLLHSLCRMSFDVYARQNLADAVRTAKMLITASNNIFNEDQCRRILLPAVERRGNQVEATRRPNNDQGNEEVDEGDENNDETAINNGEATTTLVSHTSILTMTDSSGETPLHALTGAGSAHIEFIRVFINACRRPDISQQDDKCIEDRRPTVYDLLVAQNYHGCTPLHFLAGRS